MKTTGLLVWGIAMMALLQSLFAVPAHAQEEKPKRTILLILDGLASGAIDRIPLPHLRKLKNEGCYYEEVHLPLPDHPEKSSTYPWSCSLPNPALMSGTVFIGQDGIKEHLIQHQFENATTSFVVNDRAYADVAGGFDIYLNLREEFEDIFRDAMVFDKTKAVIKSEDPAFLRVHLQGPGSSGHRSNEAENLEQPWYHDIWHPESPYIKQMRQADRLTADFINWMEEEGYMDETLLLIMGDHGQAHIGGHPPYRPESNKTELLVLGKGVKAGARYEYAEIIDIAPTIAYLHALPPPRYATGRVLKEAFAGGPDAPPASRDIETLNGLLLEAGYLEKSGKALPVAFQGILDISTWHTVVSPPDLGRFIDRQRALIKQD